MSSAGPPIEPGKAKGRSELRTRFIFGPAMLLLVAAIYVLDLRAAFGGPQGLLSAVVLGLLAVVGADEYGAMLKAGGFPVARRFLRGMTLALSAAAVFLGWQQLDRELYPLVIFTVVLLFPLAVQSLREREIHKGLERQALTLLGFVLISWQMYLAQGICLRHLPSLLFVLLVCKGGDIGAYLVGVAIGKTKLIPHVSPGKTVEGAAGSLVFSVGIALALWGPLLDDLGLRWWQVLLAGVGLNLTTQIGDLIESLLKRRCGVKDSSTLLPAHGGVLDLIDSLLFSFSLWFLVLILLTGG